MPDAHVDGLFRRFRASGDRDTRNRLVEEHLWLARVGAKRFANRGEPYDDLYQVAQLGVLKAVERFDPDFGASFPSFAMPTVLGELRRHFRDATWAIRVPRDAKDLHLRVEPTADGLTQRLGRTPNLDELAGALGVTTDRLLEAMEAGGAYRTTPFTGRNEDDNLDDRLLGQNDNALTATTDRVAIRRLVSELPERERQIIYLRFFSGMTQRKIADAVGVSQVHVSRLLRSTLATLAQSLEPSEAAT